MLEFVTLASRNGDRISPSALDPWTSPHPGGSLFRARSAVVRSEHDGRRLTLVRATGDAALMQEGSRWWSGVDGIGVVSTPAGATSQLAPLVTEVLAAGEGAAGLVRLAGRIRGNMVICASLPDGTFVAVPDLLGTYPVFVATLPSYHAVSNNALLLEAVLAALGQPVRRSPAGPGMEAVFGTMAYEQTGFEQVRLVPTGHLARLAPGGELHLPVIDAFEKLYAPGEDLDTLLDRAAQTVAENVSVLAGGPFATRIADLTGGFDSRVVLAALFANGAEDEFGYSCYGAHPGPDYHTASYLREVYRLRDGRDQLPPPVYLVMLDPARAMGHVLYRTMGCYSSYLGVGVGSPRDAGLLQLAGGMAGTFRAVYSARLTGTGPDAAAARILGSRRWEVRRPLLTDGFAERIERDLLASMVDGCNTTPDTAAALDQWYINNRNRYHFGVPWRASQLQYAAFHPLYSADAVSAAYAMPAADRAANRVGFALMRRLYEPLALLPFAEKRWHPSLTDQLPDAPLFQAVEPFTPDSPVVALERAPAQCASARCAPALPTLALPALAPPALALGDPVGEPSPWQREQLRIGSPSWLVWFDTVLPAARDHARSLAPSSAVWDVFDRAASLRLLDRPIGPEWTGLPAMIAYKLFAAGIWLGHEEVPSAAGQVG